MRDEELKELAKSMREQIEWYHLAQKYAGRIVDLEICVRGLLSGADEHTIETAKAVLKGGHIQATSSGHLYATAPQKCSHGVLMAYECSECDRARSPLPPYTVTMESLSRRTVSIDEAVGIPKEMFDQGGGPVTDKREVGECRCNSLMNGHEKGCPLAEK